MEEIIVNFDYEYQLQGQEQTKLRSIFDYLFFLSEDSKKMCLITENNFSDDYISYLENLFGHKLHYSSIATKIPKYWWGALTDLPRERKLNDKETALKLNKIKYIKIENEDQLQSYLLEYLNKVFFVKTHFSFSGRGNFVLPKDLEKVKRILRNQEVLLMPYFKIQEEYGNIFLKENEKIKCIEHYENIIQDNHYKGTVYYPENSFSFNNEQTLQLLNSLDLKDGEQIQVDGFSYIDQNNDLQNLMISEINFRKTMFHFLKGITSKLQLKNKIQLLISKNNNQFTSFSQKLQSYQQQKNLFNGGTGVIPVSPVSSSFDVVIKIS